ncbi:hypothetical protein [Frondihabitans cladoniiphilus]|uniref:Uncharacterized protein n=1 Tax=Frondihabitans cladoniiphilus TaxID=715785 RepID=A0ABP8VR14_9MICO
MDVEPFPWDHYSRNTLPQGLRYPVGRGAVQAELERAGVHVMYLSLSRPVLPVDPERIFLVAASIWGNAQSGLRNGNLSRRSTTSLTIEGVPAGLSAEVPTEAVVEEVAAAIAWIKTTLGRGNAWLSSDHSFWSASVEGVVTRHES